MNLLSLPHSLGLLMLALGLSAASAVGVFRIRARMRGTRGLVRSAWLFLCGVEAAGGVWGAILLSTLAFVPSVPGGFHPLGVLGSLLITVTGSTLAFAMAWNGKEMQRRATGGALLIMTIAAAHFSALVSLQGVATLLWEPVGVWLAVAVGGVLAVLAVVIAGTARSFALQAAGVLLTVGAVAAFQMGSLGAATVVLDPNAALPPQLLDRTAVIFTVCLISILTILGGLGAAYIDDSSHRRALTRMQRLADATREGIAVLDDRRVVVDCNAAFAALCGATATALIGTRLDVLLTPDGDGELTPGTPSEAHLKALDGLPVPVIARLGSTGESAEEGRPGLILTVSDVREQRAAEAHIRFLSEHDALTGLPNRSVLTAQLDAGVRRVTENGRENLVLLCIRVVNSQAVNTLHGHTAGDALLAKVAERLKRLAGDSAGAARIGGDEFAFHLFSERREGEMEAGEAFFAKASQVLSRPFVWNAHAIEPEIRIGVAGVPHDSTDAAELLMHAESAVMAEGDRVGGVQLFRRELHDAITAQRALAHDLRAAIAADELTVYYQPQARAEDGKLCGFEALVRWRHPVHGFLAPDRFIGVAEASGLIGALGEWVLRRACLDAMSWPKPVPVAVNLSPLQVGEPGLPARVHEILIEMGLPPHRLELEITESALFRDYQRALDTLRRLKALGVKIAMDDFGTGFSSLSTLQSFPFDKIKIDKSFVEGVGVLERSTVIVRAVLGIGRGLAIPVVAEGVETAEQMAFLRDEQCSVVQGYYIGRPGPIELHASMIEDAPVPARTPRRTAAA